MGVPPHSKIRGPAKNSEYELFAANGARMATYGTVAIHLNLSLRCAFKWNFTVADVQTPIIGMDFLSHFGLLVQPRNKKLLDTTTQLSWKRRAAADNVPSIKTADSAYHQLLAEFPRLTRPLFYGKEKARHSVIQARPANLQLRRLAPDRLKQVKVEFEPMSKA